MISGLEEALVKGRYRVRCAMTAAEIEAAQILRARCFGTISAPDCDPFDQAATHVLVENVECGQVVCCYRLTMTRGGALGACYSAQFYDLTKLTDFPGAMLELGRFCIDPDWRDPDILRIAWAALTRLVDHNGVGFLFGCSSYEGTDPTVYSQSFSRLYRSHLGPDQWRPARKAPDVVPLEGHPETAVPQRMTPALLRTYLVMGGWVSDHAVVDHALGTLHVFTGLEISAIPLARQRLLRSLV